MLIYKIFRSEEWQAMQAAGESQGAPIDLQDGYVHLSTGAQATGTAAKHFAGSDNLVLLALDSNGLGPELKWEVSRGDALFPHLYRNLRMDDVVWCKPLPLLDGVHAFPEEMT